MGDFLGDLWQVRPMVERIDACVLQTGRLDAVVAFYRALGLPLAEEAHDGGPVHWACEVGGAHFAVYAAVPGEAPVRGMGGATMVGFRVDDLAAAVEAARGAGARVIVEPEAVPWGRRAVLADPDGRPVELNAT